MQLLILDGTTADTFLRERVLMENSLFRASVTTFDVATPLCVHERSPIVALLRQNGYMNSL